MVLKAVYFIRYFSYVKEQALTHQLEGEKTTERYD